MQRGRMVTRSVSTCIHARASGWAPGATERAQKVRGCGPSPEGQPGNEGAGGGPTAVANVTPRFSHNHGVQRLLPVEPTPTLGEGQVFARSGMATTLAGSVLGGSPEQQEHHRGTCSGSKFWAPQTCRIRTSGAEAGI